MSQATSSSHLRGLSSDQKQALNPDLLEPFVRVMLRAAVLALLLRACAARSCYKIDLVDWPKLPEDCTYLGLGRSKEDGDALAASLAEALPATQVTNINLMGNNIGDRGAAALASALKANGTLCELYLPRNGITDTGVAELAEALKTNTAVHTLLLHEYSGVQEALLREVRSVLQGREEAACRARAMNEETGSWFDVRPRS